MDLSAGRGQALLQSAGRGSGIEYIAGVKLALDLQVNRLTVEDPGGLVSKTTTRLLNRLLQTTRNDEERRAGREDRGC